MAITDTRPALNKLIHNYDARVISVSGLWGSGKTHLWKEIKKDSSDEKIRSSRYVSLYGISNIKSLKEALLRNILGSDEERSNFRKRISSLSSYATNVTSQFVKGVPAVLDFSDVALPYYLKGAFVVIDDIERFDKDFSIRQMMGFINEYVTQYKTRFLLIMNREEMCPDDINSWEEMNEKIIDYELSHTITPEEALGIASIGNLLSYKNELLNAIRILNINNIRVIKKILNICALILPDESKLRPGALSRVIPAIVLTGAVYYKIVSYWDNINEYMIFMDKFSSVSIFKHLPKVQNEKDKDAHNIINKLGVIAVDGLVSAIIIIIESALTKKGGVHDLIKSISDKEAELLAQNKYLNFHNNYYWDFNKSDEILLQEAEELFKDVRYLNPRDMSGLLDFMENEGVFASLVNRFRDEWIRYNGNKSKTYPENELKTADGEQIRNDIYSQVNVQPKPPVVLMRVKEALRYITENNGWGEKQAAVFRSATVSSIKGEIYGMSGNDLRTFIGDVALVSQPSMADTPGFSGIAYKLRQAADAIIAEELNLRLCTVLKESLYRFVPSQNAGETDDGLSPFPQ